MFSDAGQPKRHLLTTGWSVFVSAKRLVAGDSVLFIWSSFSPSHTLFFIVAVVFLGAREQFHDYLS